jgi:peroxiredoxin Q/BCP
LRDRIAELQAKGVMVLGVSTDTAASHKDFAAKLKLPFSLLADEHQAMTKAYGVLKSLDTGGEHFDYAQRSFFLVGPDGRLLYVDPDFKLTEPGWKALFAAVEKLPRATGKPKQK